ncbi:Ribonuclease [Andreprevotia sp. IGB-42]|uniref:ribonuclease domain-containing protein n=1 Tax=Andreprevotia sp. IGB-42 TaxID=2497473 RepID=UPI0013571EF2|nr:ribonuclease domain-containing protein [Andreprevotia sp. IGB-42]KAF0811672.1 Ribonuclease [Andreprevotia sp. IGB-42]
MRKTLFAVVLTLFAVVLTLLATNALAQERCQDVAATIARVQRINADELTRVLISLNNDGKLPAAQFITKREAQAAGWQPGKDLWAVLPQHSIGGDRFGNYERALPAGSYKEADLDYRGGKRGAKRLVFDVRGKRYITTDHYKTFTEVPQCH